LGRADCVIIPSGWKEWDVAAGWLALHAEQQYLLLPSRSASNQLFESSCLVSDLFSSINTKKHLPLLCGSHQAIQFFKTPNSIKLLNI